ncbi:hypothetical protein A1O3_01413 [Capronia epimyces CBS 606.96]|uniref:Uncharacterized protein n=1 Tax=Capronia epimyces CBS 606.96 TaxID=1182542 RepID=W9ZEF4_9EURO|nr:uncharacterized protein A1O3_01413 [Capronia epimyces CBS 606.96]EXJ92859.1 hypothetical protein A1O3_01413 [Capronia epimyces CBS 606.96]
MPASKLIRHFDRSKIAPVKGGSNLSTRSRFIRRQDTEGSPPPPSSSPAQDPKLPSGLDDLSSDEDDSEGEDDLSDDEEDSDDFNPFDPGAATRSGSSTISQTTSMVDNPFIPKSTVTGSATPISQGQSAHTHPATSTLATSTTSLDSVPGVATNAASTSADSSSSSVESSKSPHMLTAVVIASVLAAISVLAIAYLLFRFCTPLKARLAKHRGRRGQSLSSQEENGTAPRRLLLGMSQANNLSGAETLRHTLNAPPSAIATPAPAYTRHAPVSSTRMFPAVPLQNGGLEKDPENPFTDQVPPSRSSSVSSRRLRIRSFGDDGLRDGLNHDIDNRPPTYRRDDHDHHPYASDFNVDDYAASRMSASTRSHPGGLTNNPPTILGQNGAAQPHQTTTRTTTSGIPPRPVIPVPAHLNTLNTLDMSQWTPPSPSYFPNLSPASSLIESPRSQYQPRIRKSISPSDSVSNAPFSPRAQFPMDLAPPVLPAGMNSRWSQNSSSVNGPVLDSRSAVGSDGLRITTTGGRALPPHLPLRVKSSSSASTVPSSASRAT